MTQEKRFGGQAALKYVPMARSSAAIRHRLYGQSVSFEALIRTATAFRAAVCQFQRVHSKLIAGGITVLDLNDVADLGVYVDGRGRSHPRTADASE